MGLMAKLFGSYSDKELRRLQPQVDKILSLEQPYGELSDASCGRRPMNSSRGSPTEKPWTTFCRRPSRRFAKPLGVLSA